MSMFGNIAVEVEFRKLKEKIEFLEKLNEGKEVCCVELKNYINEILSLAESGWL